MRSELAMNVSQLHTSSCLRCINIFDAVHTLKTVLQHTDGLSPPGAKPTLLTDLFLCELQSLFVMFLGEISKRCIMFLDECLPANHHTTHRLRNPIC